MAIAMFEKNFPPYWKLTEPLDLWTVYVVGYVELPVVGECVGRAGATLRYELALEPGWQTSELYES